jgi:hypothetical protein
VIILKERKDIFPMSDDNDIKLFSVEEEKKCVDSFVFVKLVSKLVGQRLRLSDTWLAHANGLSEASMLLLINRSPLLPPFE